MIYVITFLLGVFVGRVLLDPERREHFMEVLDLKGMKRQNLQTDGNPDNES